MGTANCIKSHWIDSCVAHIDGHSYHSELQTSAGEIIKTGYAVHIIPNDASNDLHVAKIKSMYENKKGEMFMKIRWFYRPRDLKQNHKPPLAPVENEVYVTNYFGSYLVDSIVGRCDILMKDHPNETAKETRLGSERQNYVCKFSYSAETGLFTTKLDDDTWDDPAACDEDETRFKFEDISQVKDFANMLLCLERSVPPEMASPMWPDQRLIWTLQAKNAVTIRDVQTILTTLEDGLRLFKDTPKEESAWRKNVTRTRTFESLAKFIRSYTKFVQDKSIIVCNNGANQEWKDRKRKSEAIDLAPVKNSKPKIEFIIGSLYKIDQKHLPDEAPCDLKSSNVVRVAHATEHEVAIQFRSVKSLGKCLKHDSRTGQMENYEKCANIGLRETLFKMDERFVLSFTTAEKVLSRSISDKEFTECSHLPSFWIEECTTEGPGGKIYSDKAHDSDHIDLQADVFKKNTVTFEGTDQLTHCSGNESNYHLICDSSKEVLIDCEERNEEEQLQFLERASSITLAHMKNQTATNTRSDAPPETAASTHQRMVRWGKRRKISSQYRCRPQSMLSGERKPSSKTITSDDDEVIKSKGRSILLRLTTSSCSSKSTEREDDVSEKGKASILKLPKDMQGRWSKERYQAAQLKLLDIMREKAAGPDRPILRPALREEARKHIGDTGLLDHLLKHMTNTVVSDGERFRRRHNAEGAMEYWLEDARLVEVRKKAGIDDPFWMPPPGWKPGEAIPPPYAGMTPWQLQEMNSLKADIEEMKSQLSYLCSQMKITWKHGSSENNAATNPHSEGCHYTNEAPTLVSLQLDQISKAVTVLQEEVSALKRSLDEKKIPEDSSSTPAMHLSKSGPICYAEGNKETNEHIEVNASKDKAHTLEKIRAGEGHAVGIGYMSSYRPSQRSGGFRVCKPEGSFLWPGMASTSSKSFIQVEDMLSAIQVAATPATPVPPLKFVGMKQEQQQPINRKSVGDNLLAAPDSMTSSQKQQLKRCGLSLPPPSMGLENNYNDNDVIAVGEKEGGGEEHRKNSAATGSHGRRISATTITTTSSRLGVATSPSLCRLPSSNVSAHTFHGRSHSTSVTNTGASICCGTPSVPPQRDENYSMWPRIFNVPYSSPCKIAKPAAIKLLPPGPLQNRNNSESRKPSGLATSSQKPHLASPVGKASGCSSGMIEHGLLSLATYALASNTSTSPQVLDSETRPNKPVYDLSCLGLKPN